MINWIVTVNRPSYLETQALLVPKEKITELVTQILEDGGVWADGDYITIKPTKMEYFDGRP